MSTFDAHAAHISKYGVEFIDEGDTLMFAATDVRVTTREGHDTTVAFASPDMHAVATVNEVTIDPKGITYALFVHDDTPHVG